MGSLMKIQYKKRKRRQKVEEYVTTELENTVSAMQKF